VTRRDLLPASALPLAYFALAHTGLGAAFILLALNPDLPGGYFLHPRMVALVHLVTLAWISGSILGAFYIVAPLALGMPFAAGRADWLALLAFLAGTTGMVTHFWMGEYRGRVWSAALVVGAIGWVAGRTARGLPAAPVQFGVKLHVALAFANVFIAAGLGVWLGLGRSGLAAGVPTIGGAYAHAHLAAIGWALMMVVGLGYRLLPMILPAKPPADRGLAGSAVLIEAGLAVLVPSLYSASGLLPWGSLLIVLGLGGFVRTVRRMAGHRVPRPPALPARDWSAWQVYGAFVWLAVAVVLGLLLSWLPAGPSQTRVAWAYGVAGLVGGLSQIVVGMQGRLVPLYAYYRAMASRGGTPPERSAHSLLSPPYARAVFVLWTAGVPWLAWGLAYSDTSSIRMASSILALAVIAGAAYLRHLVRLARHPRASARAALP
jgi:hypothetical protein